MNFIYKWVTTSKKEISDIFVAWIVITLVMVVATRGFGLGFLLGFVASFFTVGVAFVVHELSHKVLAQKFGYSAEFRKSTPMLFMSLVFSFFGIIFVAPGAVVINGLGMTDSENGKISLAGPLSNLVLGYLAIIISFLISNLLIKNILVFVAFINCMIGVFNMIPFWVLDGRKVLKWSRNIYIGVICLFLFLYIIIKFQLIL